MQDLQMTTIFSDVLAIPAFQSCFAAKAMKLIHERFVRAIRSGQDKRLKPPRTEGNSRNVQSRK